MRFFSWSRHAQKESRRPEKTPGRTLQPVSRNIGAEENRYFLSYQVANLQGLGTCEEQEDAFAFANVLDVTLIQEKGLLAVVADGMGGMKGGQLASRTAVSSLRQDFAQLDYQLDIADQLYESLLWANEKVFSLLNGEGGSTVVACIIYQERLYFASVGDSCLYLKRNGQLFRLNRPQNVLYDTYLRSIRDGRMDPQIAEESHEKAALTQFLGMEPLEDVDFLRRPLPLMAGDVFLLCSDGIAGPVTESQLLGCLSEPISEDMCGALRQAIGQPSAGQYQDNYTALVIQCGY